MRDVHGFRGGRFGLDAEQAREVFPDDQIQLIEIEARVFDDLADLETERQSRLVQSQEKVCVPFIAPNRRRGSPSGNLNLRGLRTFGQKFVQLVNSVPRELPAIN